MGLRFVFLIAAGDKDLHEIRLNDPSPPLPNQQLIESLQAVLRD